MKTRLALLKHLPLSFFALTLLISSPLVAQPVAVANPYIIPAQVNGIILLGPPPETGSAEAAADLAQVRSVCQGRTPAEEARARKDASLAFSLFAPAIGPVFQLDKLPETKKLMEKVKSEIGPIIDRPKERWLRLRPYQVEPDLAVGKPVAGGSYPSGHSTRGTVYAMVLAEVFPEKSEAILEMGRQIGWDRVVIAKHFLTDVRAGRILGQAIMQRLMANPTFQHDLQAARAEAATAQTEAAVHN